LLSHLIQAVGQKILKETPDTRLRYLTANDFTTQVVRSIKNGQMEAFVSRYQKDCDGSQLPRQIHSVNDQLRSRLASGLITSINPPDLSTRKKIIERKAKNHGICLKEEIIDFLAQHLKGDVRRIGLEKWLKTWSENLRQLLSWI
jgi:chromosomal replication initiator protein